MDINYIDNKKTEIKVKAGILKQNLAELRNEVEKVDLRELSAKYMAAREIEELRNYQKISTDDEVRAVQSKYENLRKMIDLLKQEKLETERENNLFVQKTSELNRERNSLLYLQEELITKRQLMEKEMNLLRERCINNEKVKTDRDIINTTSFKQYEHMNKELSENNRKINILQSKIDDLVLDVRKSEELISLENYESNNTSEFNQTLERKVMTLKEGVRLSENKIIKIKNEIDNIKQMVDESEGERETLNNKLEELIKILSGINQVNNKLNTHLSFVIESLVKKAKLLNREAEYVENITKTKNQILSQVRDINSYKNIVDIN